MSVSQLIVDNVSLSLITVEKVRSWAWLIMDKYGYQLLLMVNNSEKWFIVVDND